MPATIEERVAYLEGKVEEHSRAWVDIKELINHLDQCVTFLDQKVDRFRDELSSRINALDQRVDSLDQKFDRRIDALDQKFSKYFLWIIGIQVTIFLSILATFLKS